MESDIAKWLATPLYSFDGTYLAGTFTKVDTKTFTLTRKSMVSFFYNAQVQIYKQFQARGEAYFEVDVDGDVVALMQLALGGDPNNWYILSVVGVTPAPLTVGTHTLDLYLAVSTSDCIVQYSNGAVCINPQET